MEAWTDRPKVEVWLRCGQMGAERLGTVEDTDVAQKGKRGSRLWLPSVNEGESVPFPA